MGESSPTSEYMIYCCRVGQYHICNPGSSVESRISGVGCDGPLSPCLTVKYPKDSLSLCFAPDACGFRKKVSLAPDLVGGTSDRQLSACSRISNLPSPRTQSNVLRAALYILFYLLPTPQWIMPRRRQQPCSTDHSKGDTSSLPRRPL